MKATVRSRPIPLAVAATVLAGLMAIALPALAAAPKKSGYYAGKTSQGGDVDLYVSKTGKHFSYPSGATLLIKCSSGHPLRVSPNPLGAKIKNGKFSFKATNKEFGPKPNTVTMTGKFTNHGKKLSGTVSYEGADATQTCKSGTLTYTAKFKKTLR